MASGLKKSLGLFGATSLVIGSVIGAGVFFKPYIIYQATGGAPGVGMLSWLFGGFFSMLAALTFAEIAVLLPRTGGIASYLSEVYNDKIGFLAGWMQTLIFYPSFIAGYGIRIGMELSAFFKKLPPSVISISFIIILLILNVSSSKNAFKFQAIFTVLKIFLLLFFIFSGFIKGEGKSNIFIPLVANGKGFYKALSSTLLAVLFTFEGWTNIGAISGEMKNPKKDLSKAIIIGVFIITFIYIAINISYLLVIPANELMYLNSPAIFIAHKLFGPFGEALVKIGIIISVTGAANGFLITGSRVLYSLTSMPLSNFWSHLNNKNVPSSSAIFIGLLACLYSVTGEFDMLTDLATFSSWIFYTLTFFSVISYRKKRPDIKRIYKVPFYPVVPCLAILSGLFVIINQLFFSGVKARILALCSIAITLLGIPFYNSGKKNKRRFIAFYFKKSKSKLSILLKNSKDKDVL